MTRPGDGAELRFQEDTGCMFLTRCHTKAPIYRMNESNQPELIDKLGTLEGGMEEHVCAD